MKDQDKSKTDIILIDSKCVESHDKIRRQGGNEQMLRAKRSRSKFTMISPTLEDTVQKLRKVVYLGIFTENWDFSISNKNTSNNQNLSNLLTIYKLTKNVS